VTAVYHPVFVVLDFYFNFFFLLYHRLGSRMTFEIPRFKSHIAVSDTFIFLALLLYGGKIAIVLAAVALFVLRFCNSKTTFRNAATMAFFDDFAVVVLKNRLDYTATFRRSIIAANFNNFFRHVIGDGSDAVSSRIPLCRCLRRAQKRKALGKPGRPSMRTDCKNTYFNGAVSAGASNKRPDTSVSHIAIASDYLFIYLTYRMYMRNVEMATFASHQLRATRGSRKTRLPCAN